MAEILDQEKIDELLDYEPNTSKNTLEVLESILRLLHNNKLDGTAQKPRVKLPLAVYRKIYNDTDTLIEKYQKIAGETK